MRLSPQVLLGEGEIQARVEAMAAAIAADTPDGVTLSVVALMDGAFMFCADLVRRLPMPVRLALPRVVSVRHGGDPARVDLPPGFPVAGADLLVVEDILDTGETLAVLRRTLAVQGPRRIRMAVLLDKPARRTQDVRPDYIGFDVDDRWVVGYGLDWEGLYRNLPYISFVESN